MGLTQKILRPLSRDGRRRTYPGGRFALELDGAKAGAYQRGGGGNALGVVVEEAVGPDHLVHKHIGGVKYEDITVVCGTGISKAFYQWMKASFDRKYERHDGRLTSWESDGTQPDARTFFQALITEIGFPALDTASKDAAKMTIKIQPESTKASKAGPRQSTAKQKQWLSSNFRLKIDGTDCTRVNKIDAIVLKQRFGPPPPPGPGKTAALEPTELEIPNLVITMPESRAKEFFDWHKDFVLNGNAKDERSGTLDFLTPNLQEVLFTLSFTGLGMWTVDTLAPTVDNIRKVKVEMYCQQMKLQAFVIAAL